EAYRRARTADPLLAPANSAQADARLSKPELNAASSTATKRSFIASSSWRDHPPSWSTSIGACDTNKLPPPFRCFDFPPRFSPATWLFDIGPPGCASPPGKSNTIRMVDRQQHLGL